MRDVLRRLAVLSVAASVWVACSGGESDNSAETCDAFRRFEQGLAGQTVSQRAQQRSTAELSEMAKSSNAAIRRAARDLRVLARSVPLSQEMMVEFEGVCADIGR